MVETPEVQHPTTILFDVDGCLISTGGAGARAWRAAFDRLHGIPADIWQFSEAGMTDPEVGRLTFARVIGREPTDRELARLLGAYLDHLAVEVQQSPGYRLMPGVAALLPRLVDAGVLLGIVSGALEAGARIKLARGELNRFFGFGGYGSDSRDRGELTRIAIARAGQVCGHPMPPAAVFVVGDTPRDVEAAHAAGAIAVGVATGKYSLDDLRRAGADHVLPTLESPLPGAPDALPSEEVPVRPPREPRQLGGGMPTTINNDMTFLSSDDLGDIPAGTERGLGIEAARFFSRYNFTLARQRGESAGGSVR